MFGNSELFGKKGRRVQNKFPEAEAVELRRWQLLHRRAKNRSTSEIGFSSLSLFALGKILQSSRKPDCRN